MPAAVHSPLKRLLWQFGGRQFGQEYDTIGWINLIDESHTTSNN
jgi:hypothetical protein